MAMDLQAAVEQTGHTLLVGLAMFGQEIGLFDTLDEIRFPGRVYRPSPQRKLWKLLAALAAGCRNLQDIDLAPNAMRADPMAIGTWDEKGFGHYIGVSRGIRRADGTTMRVLQAALENVSAPFLVPDLEEALTADGPLHLEGDTTSWRRRQICQALSQD
jgi:hypothetical protein